jgi:hypothetical protein
MVRTSSDDDITQSQYDDNIGYGYFCDIEDIPDNPHIHISFIEDEEPDSNSTCIIPDKETNNSSYKLINALVSVSIITVIIVYIFIII